MIGCKTRGFSFTRALLGISADEVHLCGDPAAVPLIQEILKSTDDDVLVSEIATVCHFAKYYYVLSPILLLQFSFSLFLLSINEILT